MLALEQSRLDCLLLRRIEFLVSLGMQEVDELLREAEFVESNVPSPYV
jgi:hypothetical protein